MVWDPTLRGMGVAEQAAAATRKKRAGVRTAGEHAARTAQHAPYEPGKDAALDAWLNTLAPSTPGMALPAVTPKPAFQWGDLSNLGAPAEPAFQWGDLEALQAIQDADTAATTPPVATSGFVDPFAQLEQSDLFVPGGSGGLALAPGVEDFLASEAVVDPTVETVVEPEAVVDPTVTRTPAEVCAQDLGGQWINGQCVVPALAGDNAAACAAKGGTLDANGNCIVEMTPAGGVPSGEEEIFPPVPPVPPAFPGADAFAPDVTVDPGIEEQAADQISIVEKALQQKNRSIQQALQAGLISIADAQQAWDKARGEIYQDFLTEQGIIQQEVGADISTAQTRRIKEREDLITALNSAGVDSNLVADELAMIDAMYQGGTDEQLGYLDAMGRIGKMSDADRRMMGEGIFGGYEQDLRTGIRDLQLGTNFQAADESKLARERGLQAMGLSKFTDVDPETLYAALYSGVDVPGMAYGTSERKAGQTWQTGEREAGQTWAADESALDRALAEDKFDESVRQFNWLGGRQDADTRRATSQWNKQFSREGTQYDAAVELDAERYADERQDIADALGLEATRWELGRETNPLSDFAGMTKAQQYEHQRLTNAALKSAGADAKPGSMMERVASVVMMEGWAPGELTKLVSEIDAYLEETYRGEDLSDENVMAALMSLERTDIIMSVLSTMDQEQRDDLVDTMGGDGGAVAPGTGTSQMGAPTAGTEDMGPEETAGALSQQDAFNANVRKVSESTGRTFNEVYAELYGEADSNIQRSLEDPDEGFSWGWFDGENVNLDGIVYPPESWAAMSSKWGTGAPRTGGTLSEDERKITWLENKLKTHKWDMGPQGMQWKLR